MKVCYIAAPFRAKTAWEIEQNVRRAEAVGLEVAKLGAMPLIPHTNTRFFHGLLTDEFWLQGTLALMYKSDVVLFCDGWKESKGCRGEHEACYERNIPKVYTLEGLQSFLEASKPPIIGTRTPAGIE